MKLEDYFCIIKANGRIKSIESALSLMIFKKSPDSTLSRKWLYKIEHFALAQEIMSCEMDIDNYTKYKSYTYSKGYDIAEIIKTILPKLKIELENILMKTQSLKICQLTLS